MSVSRHLTGHNDVDTGTGQLLYRAFRDQDSTFVHSLRKLLPNANANPATWDAHQEKLARAILRGWYTGKVGEADHAKAIAYESSLMFKTVDDVLTPRSVCSINPGLWGEKPVERRAQS